MSLLTIVCKNIKYIFGICVVIIAVVYQDQLKSVYKSYQTKAKTVHSNSDVQLFSLEQLAKYDGVTKKKLYLALLGSVFDVTKGKRHYGEGESYHYFVGKDGSRAFVSGNFKDESPDKDHVMNLKCEELTALLRWKETFQQKYKFKGLLIGRYYTEDGSKTEYAKEVDLKLSQCEEEEQRDLLEKQQYPPCNMEWSAEAGSRVWCTNNSGGITRSWVGVPRLLYTPGEDQPRCVCIDLNTDNSQALIKEYNQCPPTATSCVVTDN